MNHRIRMLALSCALVLVLSVIIALLNVREWHGLTTAAFLFALWAEIALFGGLIAIERMAKSTAQVLFRSGNGLIVTAYSLITFAVSITCMLSLIQSARLFFTIQLVLLGAGILLFSVFFSVGKSVKTKSDRILDADGKMESCIDRLRNMAEAAHENDIAAVLKQSAENLKFTDLSASVPTDAEMEALLSALEAECMKEEPALSTDKMEELCRKLNAVIAKRKTEVAAMKRGGI